MTCHFEWFQQVERPSSCTLAGKALKTPKGKRTGCELRAHGYTGYITPVGSLSRVRRRQSAPSRSLPRPLLGLCRWARPLSPPEVLRRFPKREHHSDVRSSRPCFPQGGSRSHLSPLPYRSSWTVRSSPHRPLACALDLDLAWLPGQAHNAPPMRKQQPQLTPAKLIS